MYNPRTVEEIMDSQRREGSLPFIIAEMSLSLLRKAKDPEWLRYNLTMRTAGLVAGDRLLDEAAGIRRKNIL
ncbi:hypothetical protein HY085_01040 [Candidatus Gottesmanbacteria bacterium]|nr:hypothetical protein [Candidatus Gottesmanbacteria bacterium]